MNHKKIIWSFLIFFLFIIPQLFSSFNNEKSEYIPETVKENIRKRIKNGSSVGIVVGVINAEGKREYFSHGSKTMNEYIPVDENSVYEIGSISKAFTSILLADMALNNEVNLDDPAEKYLPSDVKIPSKNDKKITLEHLATHTSALPRMPSNFRPSNPANPYTDYTVENMYDFLSKCKLMRDIGEKYEYSNLGAGLLGHILSLRAQKTYEQLLIERICNVLGMDSTRTTLTEDLKQRLAKGHNSRSEVPNWDLPTLAGAGEIKSTAKDMLTFLAANMGLIKSRLLEAMDMTHKARVDIRKTSKIGLGWHIRDNEKTLIIWHNGGTGGYRTFCGFIKDKKIGVVVLSNMNIGTDDIGFHLLDNSYELTEVKEIITLDPGVLESYTGRYKFLKSKTVARVFIEENVLVFQVVGQPQKFGLFPESENLFFIKEVPIKVEFKKDESGKVTGLLFHRTNRTTEAEKIK
ncbi:MAG: serine hydrolase [Candidatus Aminicenantes bacterium]|nr:serine hydrolase [Candidatus Aminicenantes bacterium]